MYADVVTDGLLELASVGARAWPKLGWTAAEFAAELERRGLCDLPAERAADVYLAWSCARSDPAALAAFDQRFGRELVAFANRARLPPAAVDDVVQEVRRTLFVAQDGAPPRIAQFVGRGELRGWLRVTVVRQAILTGKRMRSRRELPDAEPLEALAAPAFDLDSELTRAACRDEFRAAFAEALAALTPRQRALLRYRYIDGLTEDEVASLHDVHRVTVARWVAGALAQVLQATRRGLAERLVLRENDVDSVIGVLRHQLPFTLGRALAGDKP
jgi:RNA polymerase sigma-70 factor (ECF subfamily)